MDKMINSKIKSEILRKLLTAGGDLGGKTVKLFCEHMKDGKYPGESTDWLSLIIFDALQNAEDKDDIANCLDYAINQLTKAKNLL